MYRGQNHGGKMEGNLEGNRNNAKENSQVELNGLQRVVILQNQL